VVFPQKGVTDYSHSTFIQKPRQSDTVKRSDLALRKMSIHPDEEVEIWWWAVGSSNVLVSHACFNNKSWFDLLISLKSIEHNLLGRTEWGLLGRWFVFEMPVRIKVSGIQRILNPWHPWCGPLFAEEFVDVNDVKPHVVTDIHVTAR